MFFGVLLFSTWATSLLSKGNLCVSNTWNIILSNIVIIVMYCLLFYCLDLLLDDIN